MTVPCTCQEDGRYKRGRCQSCVFIYRIQGRVKRLCTAPKVFGIVAGDDGKDYLFLPSSMQTKSEFYRVLTGMTMEFDALSTASGCRAFDVNVLWLSLHEGHGDGESASSKG